MRKIVFLLVALIGAFGAFGATGYVLATPNVPAVTNSAEATANPWLRANDALPVQAAGWDDYGVAGSPVLCGSQVIITFDLPSVAEWTEACGTDSTTEMRYRENSGTPYASSGATSGTAKVGSYAANENGFYDMHGNVLEWCRDWCVEGETRAAKGGHWAAATAARCAGAYEDSAEPARGYNTVGLRLCREL